MSVDEWQYFYDDKIESYLPPFISRYFDSHFKCFAHRVFVEVVEKHPDPTDAVYRDEATAIDTLCATAESLGRSTRDYIGAAHNAEHRISQSILICNRIREYSRRSFAHLLSMVQSEEIH